ncbi:hypothetical protein GCM10027591_04410 [Zhihengliuella somnathii]
MCIGAGKRAPRLEDSAPKLVATLTIRRYSLVSQLFPGCYTRPIRADPKRGGGGVGSQAVAFKTWKDATSDLGSKAPRNFTLAAGRADGWAVQNMGRAAWRASVRASSRS